tara:strand:+ start:2746 stop:2868 length:123 start_codon:yes stop_codon:yes gene_type:complete
VHDERVFGIEDIGVRGVVFVVGGRLVGVLRVIELVPELAY